MCTAFTNKPNYAPFNVVANQTSLTAGLSTLPSYGADVPAGTTAAVIAASTAVRANMKPLAAEWAQWLSQQRTTAPNAVPDYANPEQMNRYARYQTSNWTKPYPGDSKIYAPKQVPGATLPSPAPSDVADHTRRAPVRFHGRSGVLLKVPKPLSPGQMLAQRGLASRAGRAGLGPSGRAMISGLQPRSPRRPSTGAVHAENLVRGCDQQSCPLFRRP